MTPEQRSRNATTAAHASWARTRNRSARVAPGNAALELTIARLYGIPDDLDGPERAKAVESARKAYFRGLAAKSARVRAARKGRGDAA